MKHIREVQDEHGRVIRDIHDSNDSSWTQLSNFAQGLNQSIGRSLMPISFQDGFQISGSWVLFGLMFLTHGRDLGLITMVWVLSLMVRFK